MTKWLQVLKENREILHMENYEPHAGFPTTENTIDAVVLILENTCMFGDLHLHLPDMAYKILAGSPDWRTHINWALEFSGHFVTSVFDESSRQLLSLYNQEINVEERTDDYVNPYVETDSKKSDNNKRKNRKKIRKGPQLTRSEL